MDPYYTDDAVTLWHGDALAVLREIPSGSVDCCVTSPPYFGLRDYGVDGQLGAESSPAEYVENMRALFAEVRRVLADDGTLWLNLGSSYASSSPSGPQGKTGQRANRTFTAEGAGGEARRDVPRGDTTDTGQPDSPATGCACSCHGGERAGAPSPRTPGMTRPPRVSAEQDSLTVRDTGHPGFAGASADASAPDAPASTTLLSPPPPLDECSRSGSTASSPGSLRSSSDDAPVIEGTESCRSCTSEHESESRSRDTDALGTAWLNYTAALAPKSLIPIPWMVAISLQMDGWILRNSVIWAKPNAMPESVTDRLSTRHENVFMLSKRARYWFDLDPIREPVVYPAGSPALNWARDSKEADVPGRSMRQHRTARGHGKASAENLAPTGERHLSQSDRGRNPGDVWTIPTQPYPGAHFATMPSTLAERCILAGCKPGGTVLDPFSGSGTTGLAATRHGRRYVGIDLNADYLELSLRTRLAQTALLDGGVA